MQRYLVMTVIGRDRPGLVDALSAAIASNGGNWLESRMGRLGGQFAGILRVAIDPATEPALMKALKSPELGDLQIVVQPEDIVASGAPPKVVLMEIVGQDRPGIVSQISAVLARHQVNVEEFESECVSAPMSGEPLFQARAKVSLPAECDVHALRRDLEKIASDLMIDMIFGKAAKE
jgi:glycine cleavage system regulatory protein